MFTVRPVRVHSRSLGDEVDRLYREVEDRVTDLKARQSPVASDLRTLITALHVAADLERMGDLADHVAKTALRRHPSPAVPAELRPAFTSMAEVADRMAAKIATVIAKLDAVGAAVLEGDDDAMDELHKELFRVMLSADWPYGAETAIDGALLGRFYERYADHAVNAGYHVIYLVTAEQEPAPPPSTRTPEPQRPWLATAAAASFAASGSRYVPPTVTGRIVSSRS